MAVKIQILGSYQILNEDRSLAGLNSERMRAFITCLAFDSQHSLTREQIAGRLWPDSSEDQAYTNLRKLIFRFKHTVPGGDFLLSTDHHACRLVDEPALMIDLREFHAALAHARLAREAEGPAAEERCLEQAVASYHGDLLPDCDDEWIRVERERIRAEYQSAVERWIQLLESRGEFASALRLAKKLLIEDPLSENLVGLVMRLQIRLGDRAAALSTWHQCLTHLEKELGVEPGEPLREIYNQIVPHVEYLTPPPTAALTSSGLIGREQEWQRLLSVWQARQAKNCQIILLTGEAGIGKTRLAGDFLKLAHRDGAATYSANCYPAAASLAYAPILSWIQSQPLPDLDRHQRENLASLSPEFGRKHQQNGSAWQRQQLFETIRQLFHHPGQPCVFFLDNLQWCDHETLEWLEYFIHSIQPPQSVILLFTSRVEELDLQPDLLEFIQLLQAEPDCVQIELPRLDDPQTTLLAGSITVKKMSREGQAQLFANTEGNPLFILEYLRTDAAAVSTGSASAIRLPVRIQSLLQQRIHNLSIPAREIAEMQAVYGRPVSFQTLAQFGLVDEKVLIQGLDELWKRRIIREDGRNYDFTHDKIREVLYEGLSLVRRKWVHQQIAEALVRGRGEGPESLDAEIAYHYERSEYPENAVAFYRQAAVYARSIYAGGRALQFLENAIHLSHVPTELADLHEEQGDILATRQAIPEAIAAYGQTEREFHLNDPVRAARLLRKRASLISRLENETSARDYREADRLLSTVADHDQAYWTEWLELQLAWLSACYWQNNPAEINARLALVDEPMRRYGSPLQKANYQHGLIQCNNILDRFNPRPETIRLARERLDYIEQTGNTEETVQARFTLGFVLSLAGQFEESEALLTRTTIDARRMGDHNLLLRCLTYSSLNQRRQGRLNQMKLTLNDLAKALRISSMPPYEGILLANQAWACLRLDQPARAADLAAEAFTVWSKLDNIYPIQWPALTVLLAVCVRDGKFRQAGIWLDALLAHSQMSLGPDLEAQFLRHPKIDTLPSPADETCYLQLVDQIHRAGFL
jgi:DNA-binding SARP family transcriptional activator